jgi:hypothetical protein
LYELEIDRCSRVTPDKKPNFEWDDLKKLKKKDSIEHILPQTIVERDGTEKLYWTKRFDSVSHEGNYSRLGNLTLSYSNEKCGNEGYDHKQAIYKNSLWQITKDVANKYQEWDISAIDRREKELIKFAMQRWNEKNLT